MQKGFGVREDSWVQMLKEGARAVLLVVYTVNLGRRDRLVRRLEIQ